MSPEISNLSEVGGFLADRYHTYRELTDLVFELKSRFPNLVTLESIGQSYEGRDIWLLEITDESTGPAIDKPAIWLDGNTHAGELAGAEVCLYSAYRLCFAFGHDPTLTGLIKTRTFYIVPRISPDGAEQVLNNTIPLRSGTRPYPHTDVSKGLIPQDIDGNGRVLQMRVPSPTGAWRMSTADPRLMVPRRIEDHDGPFFHLFREGLFDSFDPTRLEVPESRFGLDFNRNYPYGWRPHHLQTGAGPYPLSEPETRAQVAALLARPNIGAVITYHTYCGALLRPFSDKPDSAMDARDLSLYKWVGESGARLTGYPCISVFHDFKYVENDHISGAFDDWVYNHRGIMAFTVEIWNIAERAGIRVSDIPDFFFKGKRTDDENVAILKWCERELGERAYVPWRRFEHPQLGAVEVGGWDRLYSWQNPPPKYLAEECERNFKFVASFAGATPRVVVRKVDVTNLGHDHYRVRVAVENDGYFPTCGTRQAVTLKVAEPVTVNISFDRDCSLVAGAPIQSIGHLDGVVDAILGTFVDPVQFGGATESNVGQVEWVVAGRGHVEVTVHGGRGGKIVKSIELKGDNAVT